jgi:hypothetical protein
MKASYKLALKGSALCALVFLSAAAGCSSDSNDTPSGGGTGGSAGSSSKAGNTSKAGSNAAAGDNSGTSGSPTTGTGGAPGGEGGANAGGAPETPNAGSPGNPLSFGGESSAGGAGTGPAVAKFCNTLTADDMDTTMILTVGEGLDKVTFTATTGECVPADGDACTEIPVGEAVLVMMADGDAPAVPLDTGIAKIQAGQDWIFYTDLDAGQPIWNGGHLNKNAGFTCEDITYDDIP